jgi:hypothetical protein
LNLAVKFFSRADATLQELCSQLAFSPMPDAEISC